MKIQNLIKNPGFYLIPLLALTCLVFWSTFEGAFLNWDDTIYIPQSADRGFEPRKPQPFVA